MMGRILFIVLTMTFCSCSLLGERTPTAEYSIYSSVEGANVFRADGKVVGQTPLILKWEDISDVVDGKFVSFLIEKPGYFTRVVFFDATESVNLKIDLDVDRKYKNRRRELAVQQNIDLLDKNAILTEQKNFLQESVGLLKKNKQTYLSNMENLNRQLKATEEKLRMAWKEKALRMPASLPNPTVVLENTVTQKTGNQASYNDADFLLMQNKLNKCEKSKTESGKVVKIKKSYFPPPKTNSIIRELLTAQFLIINKKFEKAKKMILKLEDKNPKVSSLYTLLAYIEIHKGSVKKAKKYLRKSLRIDHHDKMAKRMMNMVSLMEKRVIKQ